MLKFALLGFLSYRPMSGYDLEHWMSVSTANFWHAKLSQIYSTLKGLEAENLVISHIEPQAGRPDRRVYTLTASGHRALQDWLATPLLEMPVKKDALLLKMFFGLPAGKTALLTQLQVQLELHKRQKEHYQNTAPQEIQAFLAEQPELMPHALLWELTRQFGEQYEEMYMRWLTDAIQFIAALEE